VPFYTNRLFFSIMASDNTSLTFSLSSSMKARIRFLWVDECAWLLKFHVLSLLIVVLVKASIAGGR
jgi:hypothetical protein